MPSVLSGVRKMNWYFRSSRAFLMMLSSEILRKIRQEILKDFLLLVPPPVDGVHEDIKLVEDSERRSHRVPEGQD